MKKRLSLALTGSLLAGTCLMTPQAKAWDLNVNIGIHTYEHAIIRLDQNILGIAKAGKGAKIAIIDTGFKYDNGGPNMAPGQFSLRDSRCFAPNCNSRAGYGEHGLYVLETARLVAPNANYATGTPFNRSGNFSYQGFGNAVRHFADLNYSVINISMNANRNNILNLYHPLKSAVNYAGENSDTVMVFSGGNDRWFHHNRDITNVNEAAAQQVLFVGGWHNHST